MSSMRHKFEETVNYQYYPSAKALDQAPLLMLHGHGGDHRGLVKLGKAISVPVIIIDLPGFGGSKELSDHSVDSYVAALMKFMDNQNVDEYYLLGHSLGSAVALALAAKDQRVKKLVMVNAVPEFSRFVKALFKFVGDTAVRLPSQVSETLIHAGLYNLTAFLLFSTKRRDVSHARDYLAKQKSTKYSLRAWHESGTAIYYMNQAKFAQHVTAEVLLLHGGKDKMTTFAAVREFATKFSDAHVEKLLAAGHFIPLENSIEAGERINKFLR